MGEILAWKKIIKKVNPLKDAFALFIKLNFHSQLMKLAPEIFNKIFSFTTYQQIEHKPQLLPVRKFW